jgi:hypothetical protein
MYAQLTWEVEPTSIRLTKMDGSSIVIKRFDCIYFMKSSLQLKTREGIIAQVIGFNYTVGDGYVRGIYYTPYRTEEYRWSTPITPMRKIYDCDLDSIQITGCPLEKSGYENYD